MSSDPEIAFIEPVAARVLLGVGARHGFVGLGKLWCSIRAEHPLELSGRAGNFFFSTVAQRKRGFSGNWFLRHKQCGYVVSTSHRASNMTGRQTDRQSPAKELRQPASPSSRAEDVRSTGSESIRMQAATIIHRVTYMYQLAT